MFTRFRGHKFSKEEMNKRYTLKLDSKGASKEKFSKKNLRVTYYNEEQGRVCTIIELGHRVLSYEELKILLEKTPAKGILVDKIAWVDSKQNMLSKLDFADTHSREKSLMSEVTNCGARITSKLEGRFKVMELSSMNVEKPSSEAPAVENYHYLVPAQERGAETRNVRKEDVDLYMFDEKPTSARYMDASRAN